MGYGIDVWEIHWAREELKKTFGNYRNWQRFCAISDDIAMRCWLASM